MPETCMKRPTLAELRTRTYFDVSWQCRESTADNILASFAVSNAFLNAELSKQQQHLQIQSAPKLIQFGLMKPGTLYQCVKALRNSETLGCGLMRNRARVKVHIVVRGKGSMDTQASWHSPT